MWIIDIKGQRRNNEEKCFNEEKRKNMKTCIQQKNNNVSSKVK